MRLSASWWLLVCLSVCACSDEDKGQSEKASETADASTDQDSKSDEGSAGKKSSSGSAGKGGAGGSKASSGSGDKAPSSDAKDDEKSEDSKDSKDDEPRDGDDGDKGDDDKKPEGEGDKPGAPDSPDESEPDDGKTDEGTPSESAPPTNGDQLSVCSMIEGDCNQGLACQAPAGPFSAGRGFCSQICQEDADCSGLAPEGTKYTCSTGPGTRTCEIACTGAEDSSCPSGLACVQSGARRRAAPAADAGTPEADGDAGTAWTSAFEPTYNCRHPFAVSKIWEPCNDSTSVCGEGLRCASTFWFGGSGHCTKSCEADSDCAKPETGSATPICLTLIPALGENPPVKQCVLDCAAAADSCPSNLACFQGPETRGEMDSEPAPAFAWCQ